MAEGIWLDYFNRFDLRREDLREGNYPRRLVQEPSTGKAIVLVHGLTDSPCLMMSLADHFYQQLGYSVYLPLLHCHGLRNPRGMRGVKLDAWLENVAYTIEAAAQENEHIAVGGLSTGGALALYFGATDNRVTGGIYLFSAALGLADHGMPGIGRVKEAALRSGLLTLVPSVYPLVGRNPCRYRRVPFVGARELIKLIDRLRLLLVSCDRENPLPKRIFSAWTEADQVIRVASLKALADHLAPENFVAFPIDADEKVKHAAVVLKEDLHAIGSGPPALPLERANPQFAEMAAAINRFEAG